MPSWIPFISGSVKMPRLGWFFFFLLMTSSLRAEEIQLWPKPVPFHPFDNEYLRLVEVTYLDALDDRFGGLSGLVKKGDDLIAVSDRGFLFTFKKGDLTHVAVEPLKKASGKLLDGKKNTDSESLSLTPEGEVLVSFERNHRVKSLKDNKKLKLPKAIEDLPHNSGLEAIETLRDGSLVLIGEGKSGAIEAPVWKQNRAGQWSEQRIALHERFRPTGLTRIPGTDQLILLERFYEPFLGVRARLSLLDEKTLERGLRLVELSTPLPVDNYEGITAYKNEAGETEILLVSDDNFSPLQRTLLMRLILK